MVDQSYSESVNKSLITYTVQSKSAFNLVVACESSLNIFPGDVYHSNNAALNTWRTIDILRLFNTTGQSQDLIRHIRFVHDQCPFFRKVLRKHLPCIEWRSFFFNCGGESIYIIKVTTSESSITLKPWTPLSNLAATNPGISESKYFA